MASIKLKGDTSGEITISSPSVAGTNTLTLPASTGTLATTATSGKILQVVQAVKTDSFSTASTSFVDITGLSVTITPSSTSSKILVSFNTHIGNAVYLSYLNLLRGSTSIIVGDAEGSRPRVTSNSAGYGSDGTTDSAKYNPTPASMQYLDSPNTTSATTYKLQIKTYSASHIAVINRNAVNLNYANFDPKSPSTITVMEVGA